MNRKDIIIITVLINIGLLSVLAMMAINTEDQGFQTELNQPLSDNKTESQKKEPGEEKALVMIAQNTLATDEWDTVLKDYVASGSSQLILQQEDLSDDFEPPVNEKKIEQPTPQKKPENKPEIKPEKKPEKETLDASKKTLEITVKRGDALEKIARANGTTVEKIRALNHLKNDRLTIGQVLLVPLEKEQKTPSAAKVENASAVDVKTPTVDEVEYYVIKSGDNPWKIAKQFHVRFDDLLKLNNLDEDKARNLKIGDRIRVK